MMKRILLLLSLVITVLYTFSQETELVKANRYLQERNEVYFKFNVKDPAAIHQLTKIISIDNVRNNEVHAYANRNQFDQFLKQGYDYEVLVPPSMQAPREEYEAPKDHQEKSTMTTWNFYPTYEQYAAYMDSFALMHPDICKLINIGTTNQGRQLLAVKISDSVNEDQGEPEVFLTSSIHGDETTGYILMMHLIDSLLSGYGTVPRITDLVNNYAIFINPLANPDGTYHGGNSTVYGATRGNANGIDLNRNYPDPQNGQHPDGNPWQVETVAFMAFADSNHINLSMNFHGGSEVFNYPWDTWNHIPADDAWWEFVGREYADTCHKYGPPGYFNDEDNGVVRGYVWYEIDGGRQDYMNYFKNAREVTLEISAIKTMYVSQLLNYWKYNVRSFLNYIEEASYGINGQVTDSVTGEPLNAKVFIFGHESDNSYVYSSLPSGWYFRFLDEGSWDVTYSADGYRTKTDTGINVSKYHASRVNVQLVPLTFGINDNSPEAASLRIFPNPSSGIINVVLPENISGDVVFRVFDLAGRCVYKSSDNVMNLGFLSKGVYRLTVTSGSTVMNKSFVIR